MTPAIEIVVLNDSGAPWEFTYRLGSAEQSATLPDGVQRAFLATSFSDSGEWVTLTKGLTLSATGGVVDTVQPIIFPPFQDGLSILVGVICALAFWGQANPLRRP